MGAERTTHEEPPRTELGAFLRRRRDAILEEWIQVARALPSARALPDRRLIDFLPHLLDRIATIVDARAAGGSVDARPGRSAAERHALERLEEGFDFHEVVRELSLLRETIARVWERSAGTWTLREHAALDRALDDAIAAVAERYVRGRDRVLLALDRISATALDARDLDELLVRLVRVVTDELTAAHTVMILLREGDRLRARASVGLEDEVRTGFALAIGEGFAGAIGADRRPLESACAHSDRRIVSDIVRSRGVRALYGVPLVADGELLGVAHMGSLTEHSFSQADRLIFETVAHRVTAAIYQHMLRETAEAHARELASSERRFRAAFENSAVGVAHFDLSGRFLRTNPKYREIVGYEAFELSTLTWLDLTHPEDRADAPGSVARLIAGEVASIHMEARFVRKGGSVGWCDVFFSFVPGASREDAYLIAVLQDISARKDAEDALRASEERMRLAVHITGLGTWDYDLDTGRIIWSERTRRIFGVGPDEPIDYARFLGMVPPEDREPLEAAVRAAMDPSSVGVVAHDHRVVRHADGEERWVTMRARVIFDAHARPVRLIGTVLDVTEDRRLRERTAFLAEASRVLASSLDLDVTLAQLVKLAVPLIADFCVVDLMPRGGELRGQAAFAHGTPAMEHRVREIHRRARGRGGPISHVLKTGELLLFSRLDDEALSVLGPVLRELIREIGLRSFLAVPIFDHEKRVGVLSLGQTSSRRLGQEDVAFAVELASRAGDAISNATLHERANRAVRLREQILGIVSHDLRNPLGVIDMASHILLGSASVTADPFAHVQTERIQRAAARMSRLIRDLLDMSSIQAGRLSLDLRRCELAPILNEALEMHAQNAAERRVSLELEVAIDDTFVVCDRDRMLQVLGNLLGNAIKFSRPRTRVILRAERRGAEAVVSVSDEGPGIAPADQRRVFDAYWHKETGKRGTGLGLFISKGIVEAHDGRIGVRSRLGVGSTFWLTLPLAP